MVGTPRYTQVRYIPPIAPSPSSSVTEMQLRIIPVYPRMGISSEYPRIIAFG